MDRIRFLIAKILEMGKAPGDLGNTRIHELEQKLAEIKNLLQNGESDKIYQLISQATDDLRYYRNTDH